MTQPSRFIYNSDYATTANDTTRKITISVPSSFTLPSYTPFYVVDQEFTIGKTAASMRITMRSATNNVTMPCTNHFILPATVDSSIAGQSIPTSLTGFIYRSAPGKVRVRIIPNLAAIAQPGDYFHDCGDTLTISISTFLNPFEL